MMDEQLSIQIHYNGNYHWLCSTYDIKSRQVLLFDSLNTNKTTMEIDTQLALLYGTESMQIDVIVPRIQKQNGIFDCGLFALATATCIAAGIDPVTQTWNQDEMRAHCIECIRNEHASPFPARTRGLRSGKLPHPHVFTIELICDCRLPEFAFDTSENIITRAVQCEICTFWYHNHCYGLPNESISGNFSCRSCLRSQFL